MIEFRDLESAKKRLLAYYKTIYGEAIFPIFNISPERENVELKALSLESMEFLINVYPIKHCFALYLSSRKLILRSNKTEILIKYENIIAVYLEFPFKREQESHYLNLLTDDGNLILIDFLDVTSLVEARNEIYRVINTVILNWKGSTFKVGDIPLSTFDVIKLPPEIS